MPAVFLDTTVLIDVLRGRAAAARLRSLQTAGTPAYICAVNVEELWRGILRDEERALSRLIHGLAVVPLLAAEGERAGRWRRDFAAKGVTLSQPDCLIAAAAVTVGVPLATANLRDFPMKELVVEDWSEHE